jgi:PspA associated protein B
LNFFFRRSKKNPLNSKSNSDAIFSLSSAYITLETKLGLKNTGRSAISMKVVDGMYFSDMKQDIQRFLDASKTDFDLRYRTLTDSYGYLWVIIEGKHMEDILAGVTAVGDMVEEKGFSDKLLAAIFEFSSNIENNNSIQYLIYNYKRNNFYPFIPTGQKNRDTEQEMKILSAVGQEVKFEKDMAFWYPMWDLPL